MSFVVCDQKKAQAISHLSSHHHPLRQAIAPYRHDVIKVGSTLISYNPLAPNVLHFTYGQRVPVATSIFHLGPRATFSHCSQCLVLCLLPHSSYCYQYLSLRLWLHGSTLHLWACIAPMASMVSHCSQCLALRIWPPLFLYAPWDCFGG